MDLLVGFIALMTDVDGGLLVEVVLVEGPRPSVCGEGLPCAQLVQEAEYCSSNTHVTYAAVLKYVV